MPPPQFKGFRESARGFKTAQEAASAHDTRMRQLRREGKLTDAQLQRALNFGGAALPRSRVRGVSFNHGGLAAGRPWRVRMEQLCNGLSYRRGAGGYHATQREAELAALACYRAPEAMQLLLQGLAARQLPQPQ